MHSRKQEHPVGTRAGEAGAEDDVRPTVEHRFEQARNLAGVVLEVGVLNDDPIAPRSLRSSYARAPLSPADSGRT